MTLPLAEGKLKSTMPTQMQKKAGGRKDAWGLKPLVSNGIKIYIPRPLPYPGSC